MAASTEVQRTGQASPIRLMSAAEALDSMQQRFDAVARRAFQIFEGKGCSLGHDLDDWFQAERELLHPMPLDITDADGSLTVKAEVPGFTEKDITINVEPRRLTITGTREIRQTQKKGKTVYTEQTSDQVFRAVDLPADVDAGSGAIKATCDQGMLTITLPKLERAKSREIKIEAKPAIAA